MTTTASPSIFSSHENPAGGRPSSRIIRCSQASSSAGLDVVVEVADVEDAVTAGVVAELAAEGVAGVGGEGDQRVVTQRRGDLLDEPGLGVVGVHVEEASQTAGSACAAAARRSRRSSCGSAKISDSSAAVHGLDVGVAALGEPGQHAVDEDLGHGGAGGDADGVDALEPGLVDLGGVVDQVGAARPASSATSTRRTEFEELLEPTTITRSASGAICLTACWRFWVA